MSYHFTGLGAATAPVASACAAGCDSAFDNKIRRGKCTAACTTAADVTDCISKCGSSFATNARKEKCAGVCQEAWSGGGGGMNLIPAALRTLPIVPIAVGLLGLLGAYLLLRKKRA